MTDAKLVRDLADVLEGFAAAFRGYTDGLDGFVADARRLLEVVAGREHEPEARGYLTQMRTALERQLSTLEGVKAAVLGGLSPDDRFSIGRDN